MAMAVSAMMPGKMIDEVTYLYRQHPDQVTADVQYGDRDAVLRCAVHDRGRLLAGLNHPFVGLP
jgi:hypothetical protein